MIVLDTHVLLIVATALRNRAALLTADEKLPAWSHPLVRHDARA